MKTETRKGDMRPEEAGIELLPVSVSKGPSKTAHKAKMYNIVSGTRTQLSKVPPSFRAQKNVGLNRNTRKSYQVRERSLTHPKDTRNRRKVLAKHNFETRTKE
jgi:hypothetical protein